MILKNNSPKGKYFTVTVEGFPQKVWIGAYQEFNLETISKNFSEENFSIEDVEDKNQSRNKFLLKAKQRSIVQILQKGKALSRKPISLNDFYEVRSASQNSVGGANIHSASYTWVYNSFKDYYDLSIILDNIKATENFQGNALKIYIGDSLLYENPNQILEDLAMIGGTFTNARYSFRLDVSNGNPLPELIQQNLTAIENGSAVFKVEKEFIPATYPANSFKVVGGGNKLSLKGGFESLNITVFADFALNEYLPFLNASQYKLVDGFTGEEFVVAGFVMVGNIVNTNQYEMKFTTPYYQNISNLISSNYAKYYLVYIP